MQPQPDQVVMGVSETLRSLRMSRGLSYESVASKLSKRFGVKVSKSSIYNWEAGITFPAADMLYYLAIFYGVTPNYILGFNDDLFVQDSGDLNKDEQDLIYSYRGLEQDTKKSFLGLVEQIASAQAKVRGLEKASSTVVDEDEYRRMEMLDGQSKQRGRVSAVAS